MTIWELAETLDFDTGAYPYKLSPPRSQRDGLRQVHRPTPMKPNPI